MRHRPMGRRTGRPGQWPGESASGKTRWRRSGPTTASSRGRSTRSRSATIRASRRSWSTSSGSTSTPQRGRWCSASMRRPNVRRWTAPSPACRSSRDGRHDDLRLQRNGTTDLFAAMNTGTGEVLTHCQKGHAATDVLRFFMQIDATVPRGLAVHVVLDNLSAHSAPAITTWLAHRDRRRWHLHFTPTSSSWLNLIERWFKELTDKRLRRGRFTSVADLTEAITAWATHWNKDPKPFIWKATAADIIAKVQRGRDALNQIKSTTDHYGPTSTSPSAARRGAPA